MLEEAGGREKISRASEVDGVAKDTTGVGGVTGAAVVAGGMAGIVSGVGGGEKKGTGGGAVCIEVEGAADCALSARDAAD